MDDPDGIEFIYYVEAVQVDQNDGKRNETPCYLVLGRESIVAVERNGTEPGKKVIAIHSYVQIESCDLLPSYRDTKHLGDFGIQLNFY